MANNRETTLQTVNLILCIVIIYYTDKIYLATRSPLNPIEEFELIHDNSTTRLLYSPPSQFINEIQIEKYCQCGMQILKNICSEEQIISGCYDITPNNQKSPLRNLATNILCYEIEEKLKGKKLSEVFILNYGMVSKMALGILIIFCIYAFTIFILDVSLFGMYCCQELALCVIVALAYLVVVIVILAGVTNIVLFITMLVNFYKGTTTGEFIEYYDECLGYTERNYYADLYNTLDKIRNDMISLIVCFSLGSALNYISGFFSKPPSENN